MLSFLVLWMTIMLSLIVGWGSENRPALHAIVAEAQLQHLHQYSQNLRARPCKRWILPHAVVRGQVFVSFRRSPKEGQELTPEDCGPGLGQCQRAK